MKNGNRDVRPNEEGDNNFEELDKHHLALQRALQLMARAVAKERMAMLAKTLQPEVSGLESDASARELWEEMPRSAREYEESLLDGDTRDDWSSVEDSEFDEYGGVPSG